MELWQALILGLVQGLTEFLPVSSSGHLVLTSYLMGIESDSIVFEVAVHLGTLLAVLVYFRRDLWHVMAGMVRGGDGRRLGLQLLAAMLVTAVIGFAFEDFFESRFAAPRWALAGLLVTSLLLVLAEKVQRRERRPLTGIRWVDALLIGLMQAVAIMPGISRSGSTIAGALMVGLNRDAAARFSFLLATPTIAGVGLLQAREIASVPPEMTMPLLAGTLVAALSGYAAIAILLAVLRRGRLYGFAIYTALLGLVGLLLLSL